MVAERSPRAPGRKSTSSVQYGDGGGSSKKGGRVMMFEPSSLQVPGVTT